MFANSDELLKYIKDEGVEMVDVRFCDLPGIMQHFTVPVSSFDQSVFDDGLGFDGSSIRGFQAIHESDMSLFPDPTTAYIDPFRVAKTLVVNFFIHDPLTGEAYSRDPRNIARKAMAYLASTGIGDTAFFAPEAEFYVFDSVRFETEREQGLLRDRLRRPAPGTPATTPRRQPRLQGAATRAATSPSRRTDHFGELRDEMVIELEKAGLQVERAHHEVGTAGQAEINYKFDELLKAADDVMKFKYIVKNVAWRNGKTATFMPKPIFGDNGSGMHVHQSIWNDGEPLFYDETGYGGLSDMARYYIGGILKHAPSLLAFTNPTVNSYHRLVPGFEAPISPGLQPAQPLGLRAHPDHRLEPQGQAHRVPLPRPVGQPVPRLLGAAAGRPRRHQEQDRAARPDRQGHLRAAAGRDGRDRPGARPRWAPCSTRSRPTTSSSPTATCSPPT